jgi:hypothetical protein
MATDRERAAAGATLLDNHKPGWYEVIDNAALNISSAYRCVLGQLYENANESGYLRGIYELGLQTSDSHAYGFAGKTDELQEAWREEIASRRLRVPVAA